MATSVLTDVCNIDYGTRVVKSRDQGTRYDVYGGGGKTFKVDNWNREHSMIVSRFGMSPLAVRFVTGKFFLNDSGLTVSTKDASVIDQAYLNWFLLSANDQIFSLGRGSAQKNLDIKAFSSLKINYPNSVGEQRRIVAKLDAAFEKIDRAVDLMKQNIKNSQILFDKLINDQLMSNQKYDKVPLGVVCTFVRGPFGGSLKKDIFKSSGYAIYEQRHAIYNNFSNVRYFIDDEKFNEMKRFEVKPNDLIMSCSGTVGKIAIVPEGIVPGIINQALLKFSPNKDKLSPQYLSHWIESSVFQDMLSANTGGAAIKNVASVKILKELPIALPPLEVQKSTAKKVDGLKKDQKILVNSMKKKLLYLNVLKQSMLNQAFSESAVK